MRLTSWGLRDGRPKVNQVTLRDDPLLSHRGCPNPICPTKEFPSSVENSPSEDLCIRLGGRDQGRGRTSGGRGWGPGSLPYAGSHVVTGEPHEKIREECNELNSTGKLDRQTEDGSRTGGVSRIVTFSPFCGFKFILSSLPPLGPHHRLRTLRS